MEFFFWSTTTPFTHLKKINLLPRRKVFGPHLCESVHAPLVNFNYKKERLIVGCVRQERSSNPCPFFFSNCLSFSITFDNYKTIMKYLNIQFGVFFFRICRIKFIWHTRTNIYVGAIVSIRIHQYSWQQSRLYS